jgi:pyocin large subunit-like protein
VFHLTDKLKLKLLKINNISKANPQMMVIVNMTIHPVVCEQSDFYRYSDFRNSKKLDPLQIPAKEISDQNMLAFQSYFDVRN